MTLSNLRETNNLIYYILCSLSVALFIVLFILPSQFMDGISFILVPLFTTMVFFSTLKLGYYGPFYLLFFLIPFSQSVTMFSIADRSVNLGMHTIVVGLILLFTLFFKKYKIPRRTETATKYLILVGLWAGVSVFMTILNSTSSSLSNSFVTWVRWIQFIPIVYLIVENSINHRHIENIVKLFISMGVLVAIWGIYEVLAPTEFSEQAFRGAVTFTRPLFRETDLAESFTDQGFYRGSANYNIAGAFMAVVTIFALPFLADKRTLGEKTSSILLIIILIVGIAVTKSRITMVAAIIGIVAYYYNKSFKSVIQVLTTIVIIGIIYFYYFPHVWLGPMIIETIYKLPDAISTIDTDYVYNTGMGYSMNVYGAAMRFFAIREGIELFLQAPVFGVGFFGFSSNSILGTAENFFIQILCETGIVGLCLLVFYLKKVWGYTNTQFRKDSFEYKYQKGFRGAFIVFIIVNMTGTLFYDTRIWGLMLILAAIQIRLVRDEKSRVVNNYSHNRAGDP